MINFDKDENLLIEIRKHWLVFVSEVFVLIVFSIMPLMIFSFSFDFSRIVNFFEGNLSSLLTFIYLAWLLLLWVAGFIFWTDYYLDVWVITDKKLLDIEQKGFFRREVSFLNLEKIQDVTYEIDGLIQTFLNYGDINVKTAGNVEGFFIGGVPNPALVRAKINEALIIFKTKNRERIKKDIRESLLEKIKTSEGADDTLLADGINLD
ncbi:MAG: PH domain-containing protein [Candidatus Shapirobacteria bacterium]|nr:PH domain-containing protein [Candidatus Shapirobacteria bacterium]